MNQTLVSVVVPTYRRPDMLERCIQSLLIQNFPPHAYEIIIVEDEPGETATKEMVANLQAKILQNSITGDLTFKTGIPVTGDYLPHTQQITTRAETLFTLAPKLKHLQASRNHGPACARNIGWRAARGEIIAFTDDDCLPNGNWLANGVAAFSPETAGVSGRVIVPLPPDPTDNQRNTSGLERSHFVTANCFYRRQVLEAVGGFDECFRMAWREDSDLFFRLLAEDNALAWSAEAIVVHPVRPEKWGSSLRQQRKSFYNALLYKKHPVCYREYIQKSPPWGYYVIVISFLAALVGAATGGVWLFAVGLACYTVLESRFILRRLEHTSHSFSHICEMGLTSLLIPFLSIYWRLRGALSWKVFFF
jgi:glycosyltransferase involved in cell wall biosynthesis